MGRQAGRQGGAFVPRGCVWLSGCKGGVSNQSINQSIGDPGFGDGLLNAIILSCILMFFVGSLTMNYCIVCLIIFAWAWAPLQQ